MHVVSMCACIQTGAQGHSTLESCSVLALPGHLFWVSPKPGCANYQFLVCVLCCFERKGSREYVIYLEGHFLSLGVSVPIMWGSFQDVCFWFFFLLNSGCLSAKGKKLHVQL